MRILSRKNNDRANQAPEKQAPEPAPESSAPAALMEAINRSNERIMRLFGRPATA